MQLVLDFFREHPRLILLLGSFSVVAFVATIVSIPVLLLRMPSDYFLDAENSVFERRHPLLRRLIRLIRNLVGLLLLIAGLAMLVLPGQGLLSILIALTFLDFPGKRRMERRLIRSPRVHRSVNALRLRYGRTPIEIPPPVGRPRNDTKDS